MATFKDTLKKLFYTAGSHEATATGRLCLLDASGNPIGSDTIANIRKLAAVDSDKYVDMGLPSGTLWAKCNLGATSETGYGWYFSWGNPDAHPSGAGYDFSQAVYDLTPAASIDGNLTMAQDAASMILGSNWRMPTREQFVELFDVITGTDKRTTYNGFVGLLLRSKANGNTLFFPAAGRYDGTSLDNSGMVGYYWSATYISATHANILYFNSSNVNTQNSYGRRNGFTILPVINN